MLALVHAQNKIVHSCAAPFQSRKVGRARPPMNACDEAQLISLACETSCVIDGLRARNGVSVERIVSRPIRRFTTTPSRFRFALNNDFVSTSHVVLKEAHAQPESELFVLFHAGML